MSVSIRVSVNYFPASIFPRIHKLPVLICSPVDFIDRDVDYLASIVTNFLRLLLFIHQALVLFSEESFISGTPDCNGGWVGYADKLLCKAGLKFSVLTVYI